MSYPENRGMIDESYDLRPFQPNPKFWWVVTSPSGREFRLYTSEWFIREYYGEASWPYRLAE